jgi:hypothetical protein
VISRLLEIFQSKTNETKLYYLNNERLLVGDTKKIKSGNVDYERLRAENLWIGELIEKRFSSTKFLDWRYACKPGSLALYS